MNDKCPKCGAEVVPGTSRYECRMLVGCPHPVAETHECLHNQLEQMEAENEKLRTLLLEAAEDIESWGVYASDYFAEKWDLAGDIEKYKKAAEKNNE